MGYMKIDNLYRNLTIMHFKQCYALEKVHGTSAHVQWNHEKVAFFSGGETHARFVALFDEVALTDRFAAEGFAEDAVVTIYGEAYGGKQQGMKATYGDKLCFIAFDVRIGDVWLSVPDAHAYCQKFGIEFVPYAFIPTTEECLNLHRDMDSVVAIRRGMGEGHMREGIVLRPPFEVRLNNGSRVIAKHKRHDFRETATPRPLDPEKIKVLEQAEAVAEEWCVPMRLQHVLGKLEQGGIFMGMSDIPKVLRAMVDDIYTEAKGEIVESRDVARAISSKAALLFKQHLQRKIKEAE